MATSRRKDIEIASPCFFANTAQTLYVLWRSHFTTQTFKLLNKSSKFFEILTLLVKGAGKIPQAVTTKGSGFAINLCRLVP